MNKLSRPLHNFANPKAVRFFALAAQPFDLAAPTVTVYAEASNMMTAWLGVLYARNQFIPLDIREVPSVPDSQPLIKGFIA